MAACRVAGFPSRGAAGRPGRVADPAVAPGGRARHWPDGLIAGRGAAAALAVEDKDGQEGSDEALEGISVTYNGSYDKRRRKRPHG